MTFTPPLKQLQKQFFLYYNSFFKKDPKYLKMATARAGNVIGGGDFKRNRIIPDLFKSIKFKKINNKKS